MPLSDGLREYAAGRDRAFAALIERLKEDERTTAAWLSGSHGRGEDDEWSDFDFHLAVRDSAMEAILADPMRLFELAGEVLLVQANFPSESMPDGRFWLVVYLGPWHIDWNVGPASAAARPRASKLLFEKEPVPFASEPARLTEEEARREAQRALEFFWAMAAIAVKYTGRGWTARAVQQAGLLARAFAPLWQVARDPFAGHDKYDQNRAPEHELLQAWPTFEAIIDGTAALRVIQAYCDAVQALHPMLSDLGVRVPDRMPGEVRGLIDLAMPEVARGVVREGSGRVR